MQGRLDIAPAMSREVYGSSSVSQRSPKPPRRPDIHRDPAPTSSSKYYPSSISQPVSGRVSPVGSRAVPPDQGVGRRSSRHGYGVSRSSNVSPLTVPTDGPVPHSISTSAFNVGPGGSSYSHHNYHEGLGSPTMDGRGGTGGAGTAPGHHRSRSATRVPLRNYHSLERDQDREFVPIRDPRDRSLDRTDMTGSGSRHPRSRERSLDRAGYRDRDDHAYREMDGPLDSDPYRDTGHSMSRSGHGTYGGDIRHSYVRGEDVYEVQQRLNDLQIQYSKMKRELETTTQKLGSSMHSIKTFWSPELKKERALRKEEAAKYAIINDQLKMLRGENQNCASDFSKTIYKERRRKYETHDKGLERALSQVIPYGINAHEIAERQTELISFCKVYLDQLNDLKDIFRSEFKYHSGLAFPKPSSNSTADSNGEKPSLSQKPISAASSYEILPSSPGISNLQQSPERNSSGTQEFRPKDTEGTVEAEAKPQQLKPTAQEEAQTSFSNIPVDVKPNLKRARNIRKKRAAAQIISSKNFNKLVQSQNQIATALVHIANEIAVCNDLQDDSIIIKKEKLLNMRIIASALQKGLDFGLDSGF